MFKCVVDVLLADAARRRIALLAGNDVVTATGPVLSQVQLLRLDFSLPRVLVEAEARLNTKYAVDASMAWRFLIETGFVRPVSLELDVIPSRISWRRPSGTSAELMMRSKNIDTMTVEVTVTEEGIPRIRSFYPLDDTLVTVHGLASGWPPFQLEGIQLTQLARDFLEKANDGEHLEDSGIQLISGSNSAPTLSDSGALTGKPAERGRSKKKSDWTVESVRQWIRDHFLDPGIRLPSCCKLANRMGCSSSTVWGAIKRDSDLIKKFVSRQPNAGGPHPGKKMPFACADGDQTRELNPLESACLNEETENGRKFLKEKGLNDAEIEIMMEALEEGDESSWQQLKKFNPSTLKELVSTLKEKP